MDKQLISLPPLDAVRGFVAVCRRMSITLAAQDLCLTQSAVSRQIRNLEEHLGTPLLLRKHRAIALTDAGKQLFTLAAPWLDKLADYTASVRGGRMRPVTITTTISVTALWLLPRLGAFQDARPEIDVRVAASNREMDLQRDGIDLAIRYCRAVDAPKGAQHLFDEQILPVASKAVAARAFRSPAALLNETLLELDERARPWLRWADWLESVGIADARPRSSLHFNQYDHLVQAAVEGRGVALGRLALVQPMLDDGRLVALHGAERRCSDYAYWLIDGAQTSREEVRVFREWVEQEAQCAAKRLQQDTQTNRRSALRA